MYYQYPQETWDAETCNKIARRVTRDGLGTKNPHQGLIDSRCNPHQGFGKFRPNGGIIIGDKWYEGFVRPLPNVAPGFKIVNISGWGWHLQKEGD